LHTLKGNAALFGVLGISALAHDIENSVEESAGVLLPSDRERLTAAWTELSATVAQMLGDGADGKLEIGDDEYSSVVAKIARGEPRGEILEAILRWKLEPAARRFERFAEHARSLGRRLGKELDVRVHANDVRLCPDTWSAMWASLTHVIRNAVDHGLEPSAERAASGKPSAGRLELRARAAGGKLTIEVADDGRGIAWDRIQERARAGNLPSASKSELVELIFADGFSTRDGVTEISGRGVGMAAVRAACRELGGEIEIDSEPSVGTTIRCVFPAPAMGGTTVARLLDRVHPPERTGQLEVRS
jgi:chemotaxis protein histidine kinase CheA